MSSNAPNDLAEDILQLRKSFVRNKLTANVSKCELVAKVPNLKKALGGDAPNKNLQNI